VRVDGQLVFTASARSSRWCGPASGWRTSLTTWCRRTWRKDDSRAFSLTGVRPSQATTFIIRVAGSWRPPSACSSMRCASRTIRVTELLAPTVDGGPSCPTRNADEHRAPQVGLSSSPSRFVSLARPRSRPRCADSTHCLTHESPEETGSSCDATSMLTYCRYVSSVRLGHLARLPDFGNGAGSRE
jgi:hypothetical protein